MKVKVKRIDKTLPLPIYETAGSVGFDIIARQKIEIEAHDIALIPGNIIVETPKGYSLLVISRSSTPKKKGLTMPHSIGVIDQDYSGEDDEIKIQVQNFTDDTVIVHKGEKIAQGLFVRTDVAEFEEVDNMKNKSRGGFGSTDIK